MMRKIPRRELTPDDLGREVTLHVTPEGIVTTYPLVGDEPTGHTGDWRDVAIDLVLDGRVDDAAGVLVQNRDEPMIQERERIVYTLPIFSVDTMTQARSLITRFCSLGHGPAPNPLNPDERWY